MAGQKPNRSQPAKAIKSSAAVTSSTSRTTKPQPQNKRSNQKARPLPASKSSKETSQSMMKESDPLDFECAVCLQPQHEHSRVSDKITQFCTHEKNLCQDCVSQSISIQFRNKMWNHIDCPSCGLRLSASDVNTHGDKETIRRYLTPHPLSCERANACWQLQRPPLRRLEILSRTFPTVPLPWLWLWRADRTGVYPVDDVPEMHA